jgi:hypothetical protein
MTDFHFFHPVSSNPHRKPCVCRLNSLAVDRVKKPQEKRQEKILDNRHYLLRGKKVDHANTCNAAVSRSTRSRRKSV